MIPLTAVLTSESKVIDAQIREIAEQQAQQAGMTLREWLGQIIVLDAVRGRESPPGESTDALAVAPAAQALARAIAGLETAERAHMAAVDRFSEIVNVVCADSWPEVVAETPDLGVVSDLESPETSGVEMAIGAADESAELEADVGTFLTGLLTHVDGLRMEIAAKVEENAARRLDRVGRTLDEMRSYIEVAEQELDGPSAGGMAEGDDVSAAAVKQLATEVARFIEIVDARFQRTDDAGAGQLTEMRGEIGVRIDELVARIADCERRVAPPDADFDGGAAPITALEPFEDLTFDFTELAHDAVDEDADLDFANEALVEEDPAEAAPEAQERRLTLVATDGLADDAVSDSVASPDWSAPPVRRRRSLFGRGSRRTEPGRARTSNTGSALIALSLGAMLGLVAGGYLAAPPGTLSAMPERVVAALGLAQAKPLPMRTSDAPTFAVVTVSPKSSR
jgi:hypothetical protein